MRKAGSRDAKAVGVFVGDIARPSLAARGLGEASLITHWPEIVGERIAAYAQPLQLQWPPSGAKRDPDRASAPGALVLRIDGAFALEAQHAAATIVARVNAHLGWRCVEKVAFRQAPLEAPRPKPSRPAPPSAPALARARSQAEGIVDDELREAIARWGARVIDKAARKD